MSRAVLLESQIRSILEVLSKAAVAEISQLLQEDSVILQLEIRSREEEIEALKKRLHFTQKELKKAQTPAHTCSVGVQVQMLDSDVMDGGMGSLPEINHQSCNTSSVQELKEEKPQLPDTMVPSSRHVAEEPSAAPEPGEPQDQLCSEGGFGGLEFEMKIEQVEELVDQELRLPRADYRTGHSDSDGHKTDQRDVQLWPPAEEDIVIGFGVSELEQYQQIPTEPCVEPVFKVPHTSPTENMTNKTTDPFGPGPVPMEREMNYEGGTSTSDAQYGQLENTVSNMTSQRQGQSSAHSLSNTNAKNRHSFGSVPRPHAHLPTNTPPLSHMLSLRGRATVSHAPSKPFRCEECGQGFTQRTRLITHKRIHTGEKPYHCQLCGKRFSRQDNCLRHVRLHSGQRW